MRVPSSEHRSSLEVQAEMYHQQVDGLGAYLTDRGIYRSAIDRFKLGFTGDTEDFRIRNRLTIPYASAAGYWCIKYRCIEDHNCKELGHGKYINDDGAPTCMFNAQALLRADRAVLTEGELDAIAVSMLGVPAVGYPGVDTWRANRHWRWCFDSLEEVIVVADGDEPREGKRYGVGEEAARSVADSLRTALPDLTVRTVVLPVPHDSNSLINQEGDIAFLERIGWI